MYSFESYASFRGFCSKSVKLVTAHNLLKTVTKSQITHKIIIQGVVPSKSKGNGKFGLLNPKYIPTNILLWSRSKLALWRSLDDQYGERYLEKGFFFSCSNIKERFLFVWVLFVFLMAVGKHAVTMLPVYNKTITLRTSWYSELKPGCNTLLRPSGHRHRISTG